jgi:hypothetical protein
VGKPAVLLPMQDSCWLVFWAGYVQWLDANGLQLPPGTIVDPASIRTLLPPRRNQPKRTAAVSPRLQAGGFLLPRLFHSVCTEVAHFPGQLGR